MTERLLTAQDVADRMQISRSAAYDLINRLRPHVRIGRLLRLPESTLERFIAEEGDACRISTDAATARISGAGGTTRRASGGQLPRSSAAGARQRKLRRLLSDGD